jgi:arylsulfatase A-like enzyme
MPRVIFPWDKVGLNPKEITIAKILKEQGYATACIGKWHLGEAPDFLPTNFGFDYFYGLPFSNDEQRPQYGPKFPVLMRDDTVIQAPADRTLFTKEVTDEGIAFLKAHKDGPFFLYLAHPMPHVALATRPEFAGRSPYGLYGDAVQEVDWSVGEVVKAVRSSGLENDTLIVFTSDNGPWTEYGEDGGFALPLRGGKFSTYEGGMRMPCVATWPGHIPKNVVCHEVVSMMDFLPTFAHLAGTSAPTDRTIDGRNIWPLMSAVVGAKSPHEELYYYNELELQSMRQGKWKLHKAQQSVGLYDLETDIGERTNLALSHPDIVKAMEKKMADFDADLKAHVRHAGVMSGPPPLPPPQGGSKN